MPNSVRNVMGAGMAPLAAQMISGSIDDGLAATGANQATAYQVTTDTAIFSTVANGTGAILPGASLAQPGDEIVIANLGANALAIYPPVGGTINSLAANAALAVAAGKVAHLIARKTGNGLGWVGLIGA